MAKAQDPDFANLYFSNSVTQATRVRIEILKAIAKRLTTETESAFVQTYTSRPVLRYISEESAESPASGTGRSYSFVDAVARFGELVFDADLASAYKRAGATFRGAMEQYFVILREAEDLPVATGTNQIALGLRGAPGGRGGNPIRSPLSSRGRRGSRPSPLRGGRGVGIRSRGRKRRGGTPPGTPNKRANT